MVVVVDTSIIIEYLRAQKGNLPLLLHLQSQNQLTLVLPTVAVAELWTGTSMSVNKVESRITQLIQQFHVIPLDIPIAILAGELSRAKYLSGFDSVIAATALYHQAQIATLNNKHFSAIPNLKLWYPPKENVL